MVDHVEIGNDYVSIYIKPASLIQANPENANPLIQLKTQVELKRCGYTMRLIVRGENNTQHFKDPYLIQHISKAYQWLTLLTSGKAKSIREITKTEGLDRSHVVRTINRAFLAPDIIRAILNGTQPSHFNLKYLKQFKTLPIDWLQQRNLLGFTK